MAYRVLIKVLSAHDDPDDPEKRQPVTLASVTFIPKELIREDPDDPMNSSGLEPYWKEDWQAETYTHKNDGYYVPDPDKITSANLIDADNPALDPQPGEWLLVAQADKKSPVIQRITLEDKNGVLRARAGWQSEDGYQTGSKNACCKTISIANYKSGNPAQIEAENTLITATLFPRMNVAFLAGDEYNNKGTRFIIFAENRLKELYKEKTINDGTRAGMLDCETGTRTLKVKAQTGWLTVSRKEPVLSDSKPSAGEDDFRMSILHFYDYIDHIGWEGKGTLLEAGIFSHSYVRGPILWNTYDYSDNDVNRDPHDLDGRPKDWQDPGPMHPYKDVADAFADNGFFKMWGCHASQSLTEKIKTANERIDNSDPRNEFYIVNSTHHRERITLDHLKYRIHKSAVTEVPVAREYCSMAGEYCDIPSWGAPWGCGSEFKNGIMTVVYSNHIYTYLEKEFGIDIDSNRDNSNHFNYHCMLAVPTPTIPPWSTGRWICTFSLEHRSGEDKKKRPLFCLPGAFFVQKQSTVTVGNLSMGFDAADNMREAGIKGHLYTFNNTKPEVFRLFPGVMNILVLTAGESTDTAILVQENMEYYVYLRSSSTVAWELFTEEIPVVHQVRDSEGHFMDDPTNAESPVVDGHIFTDTGTIW